MRAVRLRKPVSVVITGLFLFQLLAQGVVAQPSPASGSELAVAPSPGAFERTWARTDQPVASDMIDRTWMWGPEANTEGLSEPYADSPSGERTVQYFDKSRMEITNPDATDDGFWYVTNGLLVVELMTGQMQLGNNEFQQRDPAQINVAGDPGEATSPTYATFNGLQSWGARGEDELITQRVSRSGDVTDDANLAGWDVRATHFVAETNHTVAGPFWEFMNSSGIISENGQHSNAALFQNPFYATGFPIAEAYWAKVTVAGTYMDVLMQCFERRCLTYTPNNNEGWQVEAGNVGLHYYEWRYEGAQPPADPPPGTDAYGIVSYTAFVNDQWDVLGVRTDGAAIGNLTNHAAADLDLAWTHDGSKIAFSSDRNGSFDIYTMHADGSNLQRITDGPELDISPSWSPDGQKIAFASNRDEDLDIFVMNSDGSNQTRITHHAAYDTNPAWSPDGSSIAFVSDRDGERNIFVMDTAGITVTRLTDNQSWNISPSWSSDGSNVAFVSDRDGDPDIFVMNGDGLNTYRVTDSGANDVDPSWSPDGSDIAFASDRAGTFDLYIVPSQRGTETRLTYSEALTLDPQWSTNTLNTLAIPSDQFMLQTIDEASRELAGRRLSEAEILKIVWDYGTNIIPCLVELKAVVVVRALVLEHCGEAVLAILEAAGQFIDPPPAGECINRQFSLEVLPTSVLPGETVNVTFTGGDDDGKTVHFGLHAGDAVYDLGSGTTECDEGQPRLRTSLIIPANVPAGTGVLIARVGDQTVSASVTIVGVCQASTDIAYLSCHAEPPTQSCSSDGGYWDVSPRQVAPGDTITVYGDGTQENGGWYEGLRVDFDLWDAYENHTYLGYGIVGCSDGEPWLEIDVQLPYEMASGTAWIQSTHDGIQTCCMLLEIVGDGDPPEAPTDLSLGYDSGAEQHFLSWQDNANNEDGFEIWGGTYESGAIDTYFGTVGPDSWFYWLEGEIYGWDCYDVIAFNSSGYSAPTNQACWESEITSFDDGSQQGPLTGPLANRRVFEIEMLE